jgi:hypothetical protein
VVVSVTRDRAERRAAIGSVTVSVLFALWLILHLGGTDGVRNFDDVVTALAALGACAACWIAAFRVQGATRRFWVLLGLALAAWTLAEVIWAMYDIVLAEAVPVTSWADVGYLGAIPLAAAALLCHPAMHSSGRRKARATLDGIASGTAVLLLSWTLVLGGLWRHTDLSTLGGIVALAYPFGDVLIIFLIVLSISHMTAEGRRPLIWVLVGLFAMAASDSTYAYLVEVNRYTTGNLVDVGWVVAYLAIAIGATSDTGHVVRVEATEPAEPSLVSLATPYVPVILALSVVTFELERHRTVDQFSWLTTFGLALLVLARQALALFDRRREQAASPSRSSGSPTSLETDPSRSRRPEPAGRTP